MYDGTLVFNIDGADRTLVRVNQDGFTSQYRYVDADRKIDFFIRHTSRTPAGSPVAQDRHNVELTVTTYDANRLPITRKAYFVFEHPADMAAATADDPLIAIAAFADAADAARLVTWET